MSYESYLAISREDLLAKMAEQMSKKRLEHSLGVEAAAIRLSAMVQTRQRLV